LLEGGASFQIFFNKIRVLPFSHPGFGSGPKIPNPDRRKIPVSLSKFQLFFFDLHEGDYNSKRSQASEENIRLLKTTRSFSVFLSL
jgi:hypothetical protein